MAFQARIFLGSSRPIFEGSSCFSASATSSSSSQGYPFGWLDLTTTHSLLASVAPRSSRGRDYTCSTNPVTQLCRYGGRDFTYSTHPVTQLCRYSCTSCRPSGHRIRLCAPSPTTSVQPSASALSAEFPTVASISRPTGVSHPWNPCAIGYSSLGNTIPTSD
jgi:hypothetical protein